MRSKNALRNLFFHILYEAVVFFLGVIFPRFIILKYGSEINGLTVTITRALSLISLIQAGAVGAAIFQMYKPVAENDYETQSAIIYSSKKYYSVIAFIYIVLSIIIGFFYSIYLKNQTLKFWEILIPFTILSLNGAGVLVFGSICDIFLSPHQKKYYISIAMIAEQVIKYSLMTIVLVFKLHFIFIYLSFLIGGIVNVSLQLFFYKKLSKNLITNDPKEKNFLIPNRKYIMLTCVGSEAVTASPTVIITTIESLVASSVFSVYSMIFMSMKTILNSIQLSFSAIFGNLVKTSDDSHVYAVYNLIELITLGIGTICSVCVAFLTLPFIKIYTRGFEDANYIHHILVFFVIAYTFIFSFRSSYSYVATVYGLFKELCRITLSFGIVGIVISVICVILWGMPYVMVGLIFNQIGCTLSILIILKKRIKWFTIRKLISRGGVMLFETVLASVFLPSFHSFIDSWRKWIFAAIIVAFCSVISLLLYCVIFERKELKSLLSYAKIIISAKKHN